jgi:predicted amidohydrolase YtcJ
MPQASPAGFDAGMTQADLVLTGGEVFTVDDGFTIAEAIAVADGRVLAVGGHADVRELIGPRTRVVPLAGRAVLPGINDSHLHGCAFGASLPPLRIDVGYPAVRSIADIKRLVASEAERKCLGEPILGTGWDIGYLDECRADPRRQPSRWDLDEAAPDHPVFLQDFSAHASWVNTAWLRLAGITGAEDAPPGGVIVRDEHGPTGVFLEGAQALVQRALPPLDAAAARQCIEAAVRHLHQLGITSYTEPGLGLGGDQLMRGAVGSVVFDAYQTMARSGALACRLSVLWLPCSMTGSAAEVRRHLGGVRLPPDVDPRLMRLVGAKIFGDGIPPNKTAWMHEEYAGGGAGSLCVHGDSAAERAIELTEMIRLVHQAGLQVGVHVTGDAAIDTVVSAFAAVTAEDGRPDARHYVIHGDFTGPQSLRRLAAGGFGLNMNPAIKWTISDLMDDLLGEQRSARQWPVASALAAGVRVSASSDAPVVRPDWRRGVSAMMLRESKATGRVSGPDQVVGLESAIRAYTATPAWQDFAETWKGTLQPGRVADLCVLGGGLRHADPHDIPEIPVDMTVFGGEVVHDTTR